MLLDIQTYVLRHPLATPPRAHDHRNFNIVNWTGELPPSVPHRPLTAPTAYGRAIRNRDCPFGTESDNRSAPEDPFRQGQSTIVKRTYPKQSHPPTGQWFPQHADSDDQTRDVTRTQQENSHIRNDMTVPAANDAHGRGQYGFNRSPYSGHDHIIASQGQITSGMPIDHVSQKRHYVNTPSMHDHLQDA